MFIIDDSILIFFYVDDIVLLCCTEDLLKLCKLRMTLIQRYEMRNLSKLSWFLGIRIIWNRSQRRLWLCQNAYIKKIINIFHLTDRKSFITLLIIDEFISNDKQVISQNIYLYQYKMKSLLYATTIIRSDATKAINKLSKFLINSSIHH